MAFSEYVIIGSKNWTRDDTGIVWSGGNWTAARPVSNVGLSEMGRVARSSNLVEASLEIIATLSKLRSVKVVGIRFTQATLDAEFRIQLKSGSAVIADSGWEDVFPAVFTTQILEWEDDNFWTGQYVTEDISGRAFVRPYKFDQIYLVDEIQINFRDALNADGFLDISYVAITEGRQLSTNLGYGAQFGFTFEATESKAEGGAEYIENLSTQRTWRGEISYMDRDESFMRDFEQQWRVGLEKEFLWFPHPDEPLHWLRTVFVARLDRPGLFSVMLRTHNSVPISVKEVL